MIPVMDFVAYLVEQALLTPEEAADFEVRSANSSGLLGRVLIRNGVVNLGQMSDALRAAKLTGNRIGDQLVKMGLVSREQVEAAVSQQGASRLDRYDLVVQSGLIDEDTLLEAAIAYIRDCDARSFR
ncbi:MAG: hypothetical protein KTR31_06120 [Myxococcales bacterium]|nr:hypothetical protein [Myxococcales bacterium]